LTTYISQGSVATDLTVGRSINLSFLCRCFLDLTVENMKIGSVLPNLLQKIKVAYFFSQTRCSFRFHFSWHKWLKVINRRI